MENGRSTELLRSYIDLITEAENDGNPAEINEPTEDQQFNFEPAANTETGDPVSELAQYLETASDDEKDYNQLIQQFLKDNDYEIVPTRGLENLTGNV